MRESSSLKKCECSGIRSAPKEYWIFSVLMSFWHDQYIPEASVWSRLRTHRLLFVVSVVYKTSSCSVSKIHNPPTKNSIKKKVCHSHNALPLGTNPFHHCRACLNFSCRSNLILNLNLNFIKGYQIKKELPWIHIDDGVYTYIYIETAPFFTLPARHNSGNLLFIYIYSCRRSCVLLLFLILWSLAYI